MHKILVISPSWVGDTMLAQPMLARLKQRHPGCRIDVFAPPWTEGLLRQMPEVHDVIINPFPHGALQIGERMKAGRQLRDARYDQVIVLPNSFKSALTPYFASIPHRTGYRGEMRFGLLTDARKLDERQLPRMVERFAQLAEAPTHPVHRPVPRPQLHVNEAQRQHALQRFGLTLDKPVLVLCPGAEYGPAKRWPLPYYAELAQGLAARGFAVWIVGSAKDKEIGDRIVGLGNADAQNLCGRTDLGEAIALLSCASLVISNDSGLMHLAAALDRTMLAIFGSSSPQFTPPLSDKAQVIRLDLPCSPCFKRECPLGHFNCMMQLTPDRVAKFIPKDL
jgi:lipopolysaccharide heptosyltransferase II